MEWIKDKTGRFGQRPYYKDGELDVQCEQIIKGFMLTDCGGGRVVFPIQTDVITNLIERDADDLDLYADLSQEGPNVEGMTEFRPNKKPVVKIARELTEDHRREHRLRTTLTHEYGHVKFHSFLWGLQLPLFMFPPQDGSRIKIVCKRETMFDAPMGDWLEWQAGYVCGAILMPKNEVARIVSDYFEEMGVPTSRSLSLIDATMIQRNMAEQFNVSIDAARVRLMKLGFVIGNQTREGSLMLF